MGLSPQGKACMVDFQSELSPDILQGSSVPRSLVVSTPLYDIILQEFYKILKVE